MKCLRNVLVILASICFTNGVKINMQGSITLGKDVLETLTHMVHKNSQIGIGGGARRALAPSMTSPFGDKAAEQIKWTVYTSNLGKNLKSCKEGMGDFLKDYVILLSNAIESIFDGILTLNDIEKENDGAIFIDQIKPIVEEINETLKRTNNQLLEDKNEWVRILKYISSKFQRCAITFVEERLDGDPQDITNVKKKLTQRLIIAIILVENKYESKLCADRHICEKEHEVTKALHTLLGEFQNVDNDKAMEFLKTFYANLPSNAFKFLHSDTYHELQFILSDLSYSSNPPTKEVLLSVFKTVDARLQFLKSREEMSKAYDQQLVNVILSDMDVIYSSKTKFFPFDKFLAPFSGWMRLGGKFGSQMKQIMSDISVKLADEPEELVNKLANEVRVFLELTVDPDKS